MSTLIQQVNLTEGNILLIHCKIRILQTKIHHEYKIAALFLGDGFISNSLLNHSVSQIFYFCLLTAIFKSTNTSTKLHICFHRPTWKQITFDHEFWTLTPHYRKRTKDTSELFNLQLIAIRETEEPCKMIIIYLFYQNLKSLWRMHHHV